MTLESTGDLIKMISLIVALLAYIGAVRRKLIESKTTKEDKISYSNLSDEYKEKLKKRINNNLWSINIITVCEIPFVFSLSCFVPIIFLDKSVNKILFGFWSISVDKLSARGFALFLMGLIFLGGLHIFEWLRTIEKQKKGNSSPLIVMLIICLLFLIL